MTRRFSQGLITLIACSPSTDRVDLFARAEDGELWHKTLAGVTWSAWKSLGGQGTVAPAVTASGNGRMDLFAIKPIAPHGRGGDLLHRRFDGQWSDWKSHGQLDTYTPIVMLTVAATDSNHLEVIFNGKYVIGALWHIRLGGQPPAIIQQPTKIEETTSYNRQFKAVCLEPGTVDLFIRNTIVDNIALFHKRFDGAWQAKQSIDHPLNFLHRDYFGLAVTEKLDFFTVGKDRQLWHRRLAETQPTWKPLGGQLGDHLSAVSRGSRVDVFAIWSGVALMHRWFDGEWSNWKVVDIWPGPTDHYSVLRPQDLVALSARGVGLRERVRSDGTVELVPEQADARLIVDFPPQHVGEVVLPSGVEPSSIDAWLTGPSRLAFAVKDNESVPLSVPGVLDAMKRHFLLPTQPANSPTMPDPNTTAIELPWRLVISPQENTNCSHRILPCTSAEGVTEMWHSCLSDSKTSGGLDVRPLVALPFPYVDPPDSLNTPLSKSQLNDIARIGSNPANRPVAVDRLILSALGGWLSATASWPQMDWSHHAAMGRDYYVRVLNRGALFPFGHRAVYVEVTERSFDARAAGLRKSNILIITEPEREYGIGGNVHEREFPFQHVSIEPRLVTPLEQPAWLTIGSLNGFWPKWLGGGSVMFSLRARAGKEIVELKLPLLFVNKFPVGENDFSGLSGTYSTGPSDTGKPTAFVGRKIPLAMKTGTEPLPGANQEVHSMTFGGVRLPASDVGFYPKVTQLEVALPAVRQLLGQKEPMPAKFSGAYVYRAPGEQPDELLDLISPKKLSFASAAERTGALASPDFLVDRISRTKGPVLGGVANPRPSDLFDENAKLLGVVKLRDVIARINSRPEIIWTEAAEAVAPTATFNWKEDLKNPVGPFKPEPDSSYIKLKVVSEMVNGQPKMITTGELTHFTLNLLDIADLEFNKLCFTACSGELPNITFDIKRAELKGMLKFVQTLQSKMPDVGRGGPHMDVSREEIKATYEAGIPTLPLGPAFTLQNLALSTGLTLSLNNKPVILDFAFGTRERPFLVTVSGFGGGGYLELRISAGDGLMRVVGGIEFGASVAMDFVIARGEVHVLGGIVFVHQGSYVEVTGYLRIGGSVQVLGLVRISVELTVSLTYCPDENALIGAACLVVSVDLTFWSTSVELKCHQRFDGSVLPIAGEADCTTALHRPASSVEASFGRQGESYPWETYCRAFAGEPR